MNVNYKNILVPIDGSAQADYSFKQAVEIAKRNNAKLHLLYVIDTRNMSMSTEYQPVSLDMVENVDKVFIDKMLEYAREQGINAEKTVTNGNPSTLIAEAFPKEYGIDLIVIGATGKGAITRALVGSVSNYVVKNAKCDVLIVREK